MQKFQIQTVVNYLNITLLLFTTFRYLPNFICSRNTAHLMISQKNNVIWAVSTISRTGYNIIWYASDLKVVLVAIVPAILEHITFFLIGVTDLDNFVILIIFWVFFKRFLCLKMLFQQILLPWCLTDAFRINFGNHGTVISWRAPTGNFWIKD